MVCISLKGGERTYRLEKVRELWLYVRKNGPKSIFDKKIPTIILGYPVVIFGPLT